MISEVLLNTAAITAIIVLMMSADHRSSAETLQFIAIVHRHGDRNPVVTYPNDPHKDVKWPGGLGALSPIGSIQLYTLGKILRRKYEQLLPRDGWYSKENMQVISSAEVRCVASVASLLAGFMPPPAQSNPLEVAWQPVAIATIPADRDNILFQFSSVCPKYDRLYKEFMQNTDPDADIYKFNQKNAELINYISEHSGMNITNIFQAVVIHDTLEVHRFHNLKLPAWTDSIFPEKMSQLKARAFELFTETPYMRRIKGGLLVTEILDKMMQKQSGEISQNILIYSGHDASLANIARGLNVTDQVTMLPEYGATLAFEMHCNEANFTDCSIKLWHYVNSNDWSPRQLTIPNCGLSCSLTEFQNSISDVSIHMSEYDEVCRLD